MYSTYKGVTAEEYINIRYTRDSVVIFTLASTKQRGGKTLKQANPF